VEKKGQKKIRFFALQLVCCRRNKKRSHVKQGSLLGKSLKKVPEASVKSQLEKDAKKRIFSSA